MLHALISALVLMSNLQIHDPLFISKTSQKCKISTSVNYFHVFSSIIAIKIDYLKLGGGGRFVEQLI